MPERRVRRTGLGNFSMESKRGASNIQAINGERHRWLINHFLKKAVI
jgi:hypothetical protein